VRKWQEKQLTERYKIDYVLYESFILHFLDAFPLTTLFLSSPYKLHRLMLCRNDEQHTI